VRALSTILIIFAAVIAMTPSTRADYVCETTEAAGGKTPQCRCFGTDNCKELRKSDSCKSTVNCGSVNGATSCSCDAKAKIGGGSIKAMQPVGKSQK
jgi:hypothetical protein